MAKVIKNTFKKFLLSFLILVLAFAWVFGYPPVYENFWRVIIWENPSIPPKIQEARAENLSLYVDSFDLSSDLWTDVGASPYLTAQDEPTNYIYSDSRNKDSGYYGFANTSTVGTINSVYLYIYAYGVSTADFDVLLNDTDTGLGPPAGAWQWVNVDVSSILTTWDAINAATLYFDRPNTTNEAGVDAAYLYVDYTPPVITVGTTGNQVENMNINSSNNYVGGAFTFVRDSGSADVTQIIITEAGTVDANANLSNVDIYYETAGTCSYEGTETLFGTAASFNGSEKATATGTMSVGTSQVCVYVVLDVGSGASAEQTVEIEISDPSTEVLVSDGTVTPNTAVQISGTTTLQALVAEVSCSVSATSTDFGPLPDDAVSTSTPNINASMSCANTASGCTLSVQGTGDTTTAGLWNSVASHLVTSTDTTLSGGTEGYGIQATTSDGGWTINSKYDVSGNNVGGLTVTATTLASSTTDITTSTVTVTHKAARSATTPEGSYQDTITYSCTVN